MTTASQFQPIKFATETEPEPCCGEIPWVHQYFTTDQITFQLEVTPCVTADDVILNGQFLAASILSQPNWTNDADVTFNVGGTGARLGNNGDFIEQNPIAGLSNSTYLLRVSIKPEVLATTTTTSIIIDTGPFTITVPAVKKVVEIYIQYFQLAYLRFTLDNQIEAPAVTFINWVELLEVDLPTITVEDTDLNPLVQDVTIQYQAPFLLANFQPQADALDAKCIRIRVEAPCGEGDLLSEKIGLISENNCDMLIGACGNVNFADNDLQLTFRAKGKIRADQGFEYDRFITRTTSGLSTLNYSRMTKVYTVYVEMCPEHVRDYLYSLALMNVIAIKVGQGTQKTYVAFEAPDAPQFSEGSDDLAGFTMRLIEKEFLAEALFGDTCSVVLPPKALGSVQFQQAIKADTNTGIEVP